MPPLEERRRIAETIRTLAGAIPFWMLTLEAEGHETSISRRLTLEQAERLMENAVREGWQATVSLEMASSGPRRVIFSRDE